MPSKIMETSSDRDTCPVCHDVVDVYAIGHCDHPICYRCSTRMRALCGQMYCPICRTDLNQVYLVHRNVKNSEIPRHGYIPNRKHKIFVEDGNIQKKFEKLLEHRCPKCKLLERNLRALQQHMSKTHTLFYCNLCIDHLKIFPSERKAYSRQDLAIHRRQGDKDDSSYKGHPLCQFCDERYMDNDELFKHLRKDHFYCHFCETDGSQDYYADYSDLKDHFKAYHFLCEEGECYSTQFTHAFRTKIDFQAHQASTHMKSMSKSQAKQARTIDLDIQLAPRNRRRDKGIISKEDYEEISSYPRGQYQGKGKTYKERFRDEDLDQAIQASLSVMTEEKMKKNKNIEEERKTPSPELLQDTEEFPTLGQKKEELKPLRSESPANFDSDSERSSESLAKRLAKKSSLSVQHGTMAMADFPTLSQNTNSNQTPSSLLSVSKPPTSLSSNPPRTVSNIISKPQHTSSEDFPGLPTQNSKSISSHLTGQWGRKPAALEKTLTQTSKPNPIEGVINTKSRQSEAFRPKPHNIKSNIIHENDFPTLHHTPNESTNTNWLKTVKESKNKTVKQEKAIDWFEVTGNSDEFSMENITGDKYNKKHIEDSIKNTKKKKKTKKTKIESDIKGESDNSSLDNIATSLLGHDSVNQKKMGQDLPSKKSKVGDEETPLVDGSSGASPIIEKKSVKESNKARKHQTEESVHVKPVQNKVAVDLADYPSLSSTSTTTTSSIPRKTESIEETAPSIVIPNEEFVVTRPEVNKKGLPVPEDFPSLSSATKAPPGFALPANRAPPGFGSKPSTSSGFRPPPGFSSSAIEMPEMKDLSLKDLMSSMTKGELQTTSVKLEDGFQYQNPENFQTRNQMLISKIKDVLQNDDEKFDNFKDSSKDFRFGNMSAGDYYKKCEDLFGRDEFTQIFSELLVLLPDIDKQQELLTAHTKSQLNSLKSSKVLNISGKSTSAPWTNKQDNIKSCPCCRQVVLCDEYIPHLSTHGAEQEYPSLSSQVSVPNGAGMRAWIKAK